jgi:hypothetical protein
VLTRNGFRAVQPKLVCACVSATAFAQCSRCLFPLLVGRRIFILRLRRPFGTRLIARFVSSTVMIINTVLRTPSLSGAFLDMSHLMKTLYLIPHLKCLNPNWVPHMLPIRITLLPLRCFQPLPCILSYKKSDLLLRTIGPMIFWKATLRSQQQVVGFIAEPCESGSCICLTPAFRSSVCIWLIL